MIPMGVSAYNVEEIVREVFKDAPEMVKILRCESNFVHYKLDGSVLVSPTSDYGVAQINWIHFEESKKMGLDIKKLPDNLVYARWLYDRQGVRPWVCHTLV